MDPFQNISRQDWEKLAEGESKSAEAFKSLFTTWADLNVAPYYSLEDQPELAAKFAHHFGTGNERTGDARFWYNVVEIETTALDHANSQALQELMTGADGIHFKDLESTKAEILLQDILPEYVHLSFEVNSCDVADGIRVFLDHGNFDHTRVQGYIKDQTPRESVSHEHCFKLFEDWPGFRTIHVAASPGTDPVNGLVDVMIQVTKIFDNLLPVADADLIARDIFITCPLSTKYFEDIIFLRALRILTYKVIRAYNAAINPDDIFIHAVSTPWTKEGTGAEANMIKSAISAMAGILGGCQALTVEPLKEQEMERRIARNVSNMLKEESYFNKTRDALAGAYYVESITDQLARSAWQKFQQTDHEA